MRKKMGVAAGTVFMLVAGLFLPHAASYVQDGRDVDTFDRYKVDNILLGQMVPWNFDERLQYASLPMAETQAELGKEMDAAAAAEAVQAILEELEQSGAISAPEGGWMLEQTEPMVIAARTEMLVEDARQLTLYFGWLCRVFDEAGNQVSMLVDDETGKLLAALYVVNDQKKQPAITEEMGLEAALHWAEFCVHSYGYTFESILRQEDSVEGRLNFKLRFTTKLDKAVELTCTVGQGVFKFQAMLSF